MTQKRAPADHLSRQASHCLLRFDFSSAASAAFSAWSAVSGPSCARAKTLLRLSAGFALRLDTEAEAS